LTLAEGLVKEGKLHGIKIDDVTVEEGKKADEMMLIGSGVLVRPVVQWDNQVIGDGKKLLCNKLCILQAEFYMQA
jgi:4-amino-4-deoxychorismate lyase